MRLLSTSTQVWLFLILMSLAFLVFGYEIGGRIGLFVGLAIAVGLHLFIFVFGDSGLMKRFNTVPLDGRDPWGLQAMVERLSRQANVLPAPQLALIDSPSPLVFSLARPWRRGYLILSTNVLTKLSPVEIEAVIAHQLGHLHHMDTFRYGVAAGGIRLILGIAAFLNHLWPPNWWRKKKQEPFQVLLAPFAWLVLRTAVSEKSFYQNDDLAAYLVKDKAALAEALWKLEGLSRTRPERLPPCTSYHFFVNPQGTRGPAWMDSHPPVAARIRRLIGTDTV